jgi:hypothetical protein
MSTSVRFEDHARYLKGMGLGEFVGPLFIVSRPSTGKRFRGKGVPGSSQTHGLGYNARQIMLHRRSTGSCSGECSAGSLKAHQAPGQSGVARPLGRNPDLAD